MGIRASTKCSSDTMRPKFLWLHIWIHITARAISPPVDLHWFFEIFIRTEKKISVRTEKKIQLVYTEILFQFLT